MHPVQKLDLWKKTSEYFTENKNFRCPDCNKKYIMVNGKKHCDCNPLVVDDKNGTPQKLAIQNEEDERVDISLCDQALKKIDSLAETSGFLYGDFTKRKILPIPTQTIEAMKKITKELTELHKIVQQLKKREQAEQGK